MIVAIGGEPPALAAKAATATIPIVFATGRDALASGLVASLSRPTENVTGVTYLNEQVMPKRLQLLCEVVREAPDLSLLARSKDYGNPTDFELYVANLKAAARSLGRDLVVFDVTTEQDIDSAFAAMRRNALQHSS